jgi:hypothetical protein
MRHARKCRGRVHYLSQSFPIGLVQGMVCVNQAMVEELRVYVVREPRYLYIAVLCNSKERTNEKRQKYQSKEHDQNNQ